MKIRNRKMITTLVACFAIVVLVGAAFAAGGNLIFTGAVNVRADLNVVIAEGLPASFIPADITYQLENNNKRAVITIPAGFQLGTVGNNTLEFSFRLHNAGSVAAALVTPVVTHATVDNTDPLVTGTQDFLTWTIEVNGDPIPTPTVPGPPLALAPGAVVLQPGPFGIGLPSTAVVDFVATVNVPTGYTTIDHEVTFTIDIAYIPVP